MMKTQIPYKNVMEVFVEEEIKYQLDNNNTIDFALTSRNLQEVATFALNRLPCLYASSMEGVEQQRRKLKSDRNLRRKVGLAVSQGFAAVGRDPLKHGAPIEDDNIIYSNDLLFEVKQKLTDLSRILPERELSWLIDFIEEFLGRVDNEQITEDEIIKLFFLLYYYWQENNLEERQ